MTAADVDGFDMPTAAAAAHDAAEAVRALNHATLPWSDFPGLTYANDAADVIASLMQMAQRLPQALDQLSRFLNAEFLAGRIELHPLGEPRSATVRTAVANTIADLEIATGAAARLALALEQAHQVTSEMAGVEL